MVEKEKEIDKLKTVSLSGGNGAPVSAPFANALAVAPESKNELYSNNAGGLQRRGSEGDEGSGLNVEYVKNVFVKYMEYLAVQDQKGMKTLEKVLFTVLGLSKE